MCINLNSTRVLDHPRVLIFSWQDHYPEFSAVIPHCHLEFRLESFQNCFHLVVHQMQETQEAWFWV